MVALLFTTVRLGGAFGISFLHRLSRQSWRCLQLAVSSAACGGRTLLSYAACLYSGLSAMNSCAQRHCAEEGRDTRGEETARKSKRDETDT